ncbi:MAG: VWA domain-containing protein [Clostridia bacterium]|nr:VWA domain-containing protein [Clostridia bacterium]
MKNLTELVFIIDRSGSMHGLETDTIGGFNSMIENQKDNAGDVLVSTVLFNDKSIVVHDRKSIKDIAPMTRQDYAPCGSTALLDAIGCAIHHIGNIHKYARKEDIPDKTLFVITTDGMENSSHLFDADKIKYMINMQKEKYDWEFIFLGANIDAVGTAKNFGISEDRAVNYHADPVGTRLNYEVISETITAFRANISDEKWTEKIAKDFKGRT